MIAMADPDPAGLELREATPTFARLLPLSTAEIELGNELGLVTLGRLGNQMTPSPRSGVDDVWLCEGALGGRWLEPEESFEAAFVIIEAGVGDDGRWVKAFRRAALFAARPGVAFDTELPDGRSRAGRADDWRLTDRFGRAWVVTPAVLQGSFAPLLQPARIRDRARDKTGTSLQFDCPLCDGQLEAPLAGLVMPAEPHQGSPCRLFICQACLALGPDAVWAKFVGSDAAKRFTPTTMPSPNTVWLPMQASNRMLLAWYQASGQDD